MCVIEYNLNWKTELVCALSAGRHENKTAHVKRTYGIPHITIWHIIINRKYIHNTGTYTILIQNIPCNSHKAKCLTHHDAYKPLQVFTQKYKCISIDASEAVDEGQCVNFLYSANLNHGTIVKCFVQGFVYIWSVMVEWYVKWSFVLFRGQNRVTLNTYIFMDILRVKSVVFVISSQGEIDKFVTHEGWGRNKCCSLHGLKQWPTPWLK